MGFGDEGKGLFTNYLCLQNPNSIIIRFSGGQQAGHTVYHEDKKHIFSNFGSGTLIKTPTFWSRYCTADPIGIMNEYSALNNIGITPVLYIDGKCPITTPYDSLANKQDILNIADGTCGLGIGKTIKRENDGYSLLFEDLFFPSVLKIKLKNISLYYNNSPINEERFLECCFKLINTSSVMCSDVSILQNYDNTIFEGSQGLLLDPQIGFFPNVTRINTDTKNIFNITNKSLHIYLITRAYQTRHGNGVMTNSNIPHNIKDNVEETNVLNKYQGGFRRSILDIDLLSYSLIKDEYIKNTPNKSLVITCMDQIGDEYRFTHKERVVFCDNENDFVSKISNILKIRDVYISKSPFSSKIKHLKSI